MTLSFAKTREYLQAFAYPQVHMVMCTGQCLNAFCQFKHENYWPAGTAIDAFGCRRHARHISFATQDGCSLRSSQIDFGRLVLRQLATCHPADSWIAQVATGVRPKDDSNFKSTRLQFISDCIDEGFSSLWGTPRLKPHSIECLCRSSLCQLMAAPLSARILTSTPGPADGDTTFLPPPLRAKTSSP